MKNIILIISALLFITLISPSELSAQNDRDQITVQVDGLGCPFCAYGLEKKFKEFKGIKDVKIEMETGIFTFSYPTEKAITLEMIEKQVDKAGYTAVSSQIIRSDGTTEESKQNITELSEESEIVTKDIFVAGNCGMCKARIEKTAKGISGVVSAEWDKENKLLKLEYDSSQTSIGDVAAAVSKAGHDTKYTKAEDDIYEDLPGCCHYDRVQ